LQRKDGQPETRRVALPLFQAAPAKGLKNNEDYREKALECQAGKAKSSFKNLHFPAKTGRRVPDPGVQFPHSWKQDLRPMTSFIRFLLHEKLDTLYAQS
jgi:hypothetical protein